MCDDVYDDDGIEEEEELENEDSWDLSFEDGLPDDPT